MNAIFVYEIRQLVRNRLVLGALCAYLALMVGIVAMLFHESLAGGNGPNYTGQAGSRLSVLLLTGMISASSGVVLLYSVGMTIRQSLCEELIFCTAIRSSEYILGKTLVAAVLLLLFYSATLPFLTLAWMMRGVDLTYVFAFPVLFIVAILMNAYCTMAFVRCRNYWAVAHATVGLLFAAPMFLLVWSMMFAVCYSERPPWLFVYCSAIIFLFLASACILEVSRQLWDGVPAHRRLTLVSVNAWAVFIFVMLLTVFIIGVLGL